MDVIAVHQPIAAATITSSVYLRCRLVVWVYMHAQVGTDRGDPTPDGSWTVGHAAGHGRRGQAADVHLVQYAVLAPAVSADVYFYFRDDTTGLITGVQPVHFPAAARGCRSRRRIQTGRLDLLPARDPRSGLPERIPARRRRRTPAAEGRARPDTRMTARPGPP